MRLAGKLALVTAAASGIGRSGCEIFAREGAKVVAVDRDGERLAEVVAGINACGGSALALEADLLDEAACRNVVSEPAAWLGGLDILWCHAGMPGPLGIDDVPLDDFQRTMDLNVRTSFIMTGEAGKLMRRQKKGSIIYTASVGGLRGSPTRPVYSIAKFGIVGLTMGAARQYAPDGIRVNALCPGPIETPMHFEFMDSGKGPEAVAESRQATAARVPMGRVGTPEEVARAALFLASDEASYITGVALPIDGGYTCA